jgi:hypothetical protein
LQQFRLGVDLLLRNLGLRQKVRIIIKRYVYLGVKSKLNITIDEQVLRLVRQYAQEKDTSISAIVETHFKHITTAPRNKSLLKIVDALPPSNIKKNANLKALYYEERRRKNG